jgi:hypothetical protein
MATQVVDDIRALFAELGLENERFTVSPELVIDRFDHWTDGGNTSVRLTGFCGG